MGQNPFDTLGARLAPSNSIRGALFILRSEIAEIGGHDVSYEYMLRKTSYIRADLINMTTLPNENTDLYVPSGGTNSDPVIENIGDATQPFFVDLNEICADQASKFYKNQFFMRLIKDGCPYLSAFPFTENVERGYGVLTLFDSRPADIVQPMSEKLMAVGLEFHRFVTRHGHLIRFLGLTDKELRTLELAAIGQAAADIADTDGVGTRTVELRLESARKKLRARTTTEAVYKGISYGIIAPE